MALLCVNVYTYNFLSGCQNQHYFIILKILQQWKSWQMWKWQQSKILLQIIQHEESNLYLFIERIVKHFREHKIFIAVPWWLSAKSLLPPPCLSCKILILEHLVSKNILQFLLFHKSQNIEFIAVTIPKIWKTGVIMHFCCKLIFHINFTLQCKNGKCQFWNQFIDFLHVKVIDLHCLMFLLFSLISSLTYQCKPLQPS